MSLALLLLAAHLQASTPENRILDGVAVQAGERLVTLSEFERALRQAREQHPPRSAEEDRQQNRKALEDLWVQRLEAQKGADMGLDPAQIGRMNRLTLEAERDKAGIDAYLAKLQEAGLDAHSAETSNQDDILAYLWETSIAGREFGARRAAVDLNIRPGELRAIFEEHREQLAPTTVQLRWMVIPSAAVGGPDAARASCEDARARVLAGEDLALLIEERGSEFRDTRGLTPFAPPEAFPEPALVEFARTAEVTDLSPVLPLTNRKTGQPDPALGYQFAELHERNVPPEPEFSSPEVQRILRGYFTRQRTDRLLGRAREELRRESYAWVNPLVVPLIAPPAGARAPAPVP